MINRGEVIEIVAGGLQPVEKDLKYQLEPEWVAVILLALVYNGDIVLSLDGREELDASTLERALTRSMTDIVNFRFYKRPRSLPINLWTMIFEGLGLQPGLVRDENTRETAVTELQRLVHCRVGAGGAAPKSVGAGRPALEYPSIYRSDDLCGGRRNRGRQ